MSHPGGTPLPLSPGLHLCCLVAKSCLTLCDPIDCSLPGSLVHEISQARILEWVAIPLPGDLPDPAIKHVPPKLQVDSLLLSHLGNPSLHLSVQFSSVAQLCLTLCVRTKIRIFAPSCSHRYCTHKKNRHHKFFLLIFSGLFFLPSFFPFLMPFPLGFQSYPTPALCQDWNC